MSTRARLHKRSSLIPRFAIPNDDARRVPSWRGFPFFEPVVLLSDVDIL